MVRDRPELNNEKERGTEGKILFLRIIYALLWKDLCGFLLLFTFTEAKDCWRMQGENLVEVLRRLSTVRYGIRVSY
jgi:hypothetical protein